MALDIVRLLELREDVLREHLTELDAHLVCIYGMQARATVRTPKR
jgi:hypothetical protein